MRTMPGPRFCDFAVRLPAYRGAVAVAMRREHPVEQPAAPAGAARGPVVAPEATPAAMASQPVEIAELFSFGGA